LIEIDGILTEDNNFFAFYAF